MHIRIMPLLVLLSFAMTFLSCNRNGKQERKVEVPSSIDAAGVTWQVGVLAYTFRQFTFFEAVDKAKELGLSYIGGYPGQEIGGGIEGKLTVDLEEGKRKQILAYLHQQNVKLIDFGVITPKTEEEWRKLFAFAKAMGIPAIVSEPHPDQLKMVVALGDEFNIDIAIHNHPSPSLYANPDTLLSVIQDYGNRLGVCADVGHWVRSGYDPVESLRKLEGRLMELHFKDESVRGKEAVEIVWGTGVADVKGMLEELRRQRFSGILAVEYESKPEDNMAEIRESLDYYEEITGSW